MSHELRTPLNSIIGFANVLLKNKSGRLIENDLSYLTRIATNGRHLLGLINDILDLSKIESGTVTVMAEEVIVRNLMDGDEVSGEIDIDVLAEDNAATRPLVTLASRVWSALSAA